MVFALVVPSYLGLLAWGVAFYFRASARDDGRRRFAQVAAVGGALFAMAAVVSLGAASDGGAVSETRFASWLAGGLFACLAAGAAASTLIPALRAWSSAIALVLPPSVLLLIDWFP